MTEVRNRFDSVHQIPVPTEWPDLDSVVLGTPPAAGRPRRILIVTVAFVVLAVGIGAIAWAFLGPRSRPTQPARPGLVVPKTYQEACAREGVCLPGATGEIPAALKRQLRFPVLSAGEQCPVTPGHQVDTPYFGGIALGTGLVRPLITTEGDLLHGTTYAAAQQGWLVFQTLWFSRPGYQGPFIIRAERIDAPGEVEFGGSSPAPGPLVVPPGPTINTYAGYRTIPGGTWVRAPGCYAWQVDGLTFSDVIVVRVLPLPVQGPNPCSVLQLALDYQGGGAGAGNDFGTIWIRDVSGRPCGLVGPVQVTGTDRAGKAVTQTITYQVQGGLVLSPRAAAIPLGSTPPACEIAGSLLLSAAYRDDPTSANGLCEQHLVVPAFWQVRFPTGMKTVANTSQDSYTAFSSLITCRGELNTPTPIGPG